MLEDCNNVSEQLMEVCLIIAYIISSQRRELSHRVLPHPECHTLVYFQVVKNLESGLDKNRASVSEDPDSLRGFSEGGTAEAAGKQAASRIA